MLVGDDGDDTYIYGLNDGFDRIRDKGIFGNDQIIINDYLLADASISQMYDSNDVLIDFGSGNKLIIYNTLQEDSTDGIESIHFNNGGDVLSMADIRNQILSAKETTGDDIIVGYFASETYNAGLGNDFIDGKSGSDNYLFTAGDGHDIIADTGGFDTDVLTITGYNSTDVTIITNVADTKDVTFSFNSGSDTIELINALSNVRRIESYVFDDMTWSNADLITQVNNNGANIITIPTNDGTQGMFTNDTLISSGSDEIMRGFNGSDTYQLTYPFGHIIVDDNGLGDNDIIVFHNVSFFTSKISTRLGYGNNDLVITFDSDNSVTVKNYLSGDDQIETYDFVDSSITLTPPSFEFYLIFFQQTQGNDLIQGFPGDNSLDMGKGDDYLIGADGSDTYIYQIGDGNDIIKDKGLDDLDELRIFGYLSTDAEFRLLQDDRKNFVIRFNDNDSITLVDSINKGLENKIEQIVFKNDVPEKIYTMDDLQTLFIAQQTTSGNDYVGKFFQGNTYPASAGDDQFIGGDGSDIYQFNIGSGQDRIEDNGLGDTDIIEIYGYLPSDVTLVYYPVEINTIILKFNDNDTLTIVNTLDGNLEDGIEEIHFMDDPMNTVWTMSDLRQMLFNQLQSVNDDYIKGFNIADTIPSNKGIDRHIGADGNDTYEFNMGDDTLIIDDQGLGDTDNILISGYSSTDAIYSRLVPGSTALLIEFTGSTDRIIVMNTLFTNIHDAVETITFQGDGMTKNIIMDIEPLL
jgi:Ca2+-binding RTX toxin-like protein